MDRQRRELRIVPVGHGPTVWEILTEEMTQPHGAYVGSGSPRSVRVPIETGDRDDAMSRISPPPVKYFCSCFSRGCNLLELYFSLDSLVQRSKAVKVLIHKYGFAGIAELHVVSGAVSQCQQNRRRVGRELDKGGLRSVGVTRGSHGGLPRIDGDGFRPECLGEDVSQRGDGGERRDSDDPENDVFGGRHCRRVRHLYSLDMESGQMDDSIVEA